MLCVQNSSRTLVEIQVCKQGRVVLSNKPQSTPHPSYTHKTAWFSPPSLPSNVPSTALCTDVAFSSSPAFSIPISQCYQKWKTMCVSALRLRFTQIPSRLVVHTLNKFHENWARSCLLSCWQTNNQTNKSSASLIQATTIATLVKNGKTYRTLNTRNISSHFSALLPLDRSEAGGVDGWLISQMYSLSPAPYLPSGIATFPFLIIMNDSALPPSLPLFSLYPYTPRRYVSDRDVINHEDTLLVLIVRVLSFSLLLCLLLLFFISLCLPQSLSISLTHIHTQFEGLINHLLI